jgi:hypothetical protein
VERLPHLEAFNALVEADGNLESLLAFALYMQAECLWAKNLPKEPTSLEIRKFHQGAVMAHALEKTQAEARQVLTDYTVEVVQTHQKKYLKSVVEDVTEGMHSSRGHFWSWVKEAIAGAFFWTLILILIAIILRLGPGIDIIEVSKRFLAS